MNNDLLTFNDEEDVKAIMLELAKIGRSDIRQFFNEATGELLPVEQWPDNAAAAASSVKVTVSESMTGTKHVTEVKLWDKNAALEKLAKIYKLYSDARGTDETERSISDIVNDSSVEDAAKVWESMAVVGKDK